jgi:DnaJ-class molecular chaperone
MSNLRPPLTEIGKIYIKYLRKRKPKKVVLKDWINCPICDGKGTSYFGKKCSECKGSKIIERTNHAKKISIKS